MSSTKIDFTRPELMRIIKQVRPGVWEIPKSFRPYMNVPVRIYMTKKMLDKTEDGAIQQAMNVASLPGIQKWSIMMPDAHWGYGFCVGGVAAFDLEEGIVSPGGIGYDINCLSPDSRVLSEFGFWVRVGDLPGSFEVQRVKVYDVEGGHNDSSEVSFVAVRDVGKGESAFRLVTEGGWVVEGSVDHPVLTVEGYRELGELVVGDHVVVYPFEGVEYVGSDEVLLTEDDFADSDPQIVGYLKEKGLLPLKLSDPKVGLIARILGFGFGDGSLTYMGERINISFFGDRDVLLSVKKDLEKLGVKSFLYSRDREYSITTAWGKQYEGTSTDLVLRVSSRAFALLMAKLGMPIGKRTEIAYRVPEWIKRAPKWVKRNFLAGLFGADGSIVEFKKFTPLPINLTQSKKAELKDSLIEFLSDISDLLKEFNVRTLMYEIKSVEGKVTYRLATVSEEDVKNFLGFINYEYSQAKKEKGLWVYGYLKRKDLVKELRRKAAETARKIHEKTGSLKKAYEAVKGKYVNKRFIERAIYEKPKEVRVPENFLTFDEFVEKYGLSGGFIAEKIEKIEVYKPNYDRFYDIGVTHKAHNFIANGIVVHNCGVRYLTTNLSFKDLKPRIRELVGAVERFIAAGVGRGGRVRLSVGELDELLVEGARWAVEHGYGFEEDLRHIEDGGRIEGADPSKVSARAKKRGHDQVGSLGSGNHYAEVEIVEKIFDEGAAKKMGIYEEGQIGVMIHTGSRGFGHQVASDYIDVMVRAHRKYGIKLRDIQLACAPYNSREAQDYLAAMRAAANFAFANRQILTHWMREAFREVFGDDVELKLVYDVAHNIGKVERHTVDGVVKEVIVHRKGATRGFPAGRPEIPEDYRDIGQPILVGGSMREGAYILLGTKTSLDEVFGSTVHGAGRTLSRKAAKRRYRDWQVRKDLEKLGIYVSAASRGELAEEAPEAYKSLEEVVGAAVEAGIAKRVVKTRPVIVRKG
ncbi:MAG: intein-containing RctB family protein [Candidatus Njordarchaeia archaeon]